MCSFNLNEVRVASSRDTGLAGSSRSPKARAPAGQASTQAGTTSVPTCLPSRSAASMRWKQKVHFSTTPWVRCGNGHGSIDFLSGGRSGRWYSSSSCSL